MQRAAVLFFFVVLCCSVSFAKKTSKPMTDHHQPRMVGGWMPIDKSKSDERLTAVTEFVATQLPQSGYDFAAASSNTKLVVLDGTQQVVAGMNYRLHVALVKTSDADNNPFNEHAIVGAFAVTVYDQFGTMQVTKWGPELDVVEAKTKLEEMKKDKD